MTHAPKPYVRLFYRSNEREAMLAFATELEKQNVLVDHLDMKTRRGYDTAVWYGLPETPAVLIVDECGAELLAFHKMSKSVDEMFDMMRKGGYSGIEIRLKKHVSLSAASR